jgi:hypothetical protein
MFTSLHMSVEEAMREFAIICEQVYGTLPLDSERSSTKLRACIEEMMERKGTPLDKMLIGSQENHPCKGYASSGQDVLWKLNLYLDLHLLRSRRMF